MGSKGPSAAPAVDRFYIGQAADEPADDSASARPLDAGGLSHSLYTKFLTVVPQASGDLVGVPRAVRKSPRWGTAVPYTWRVWLVLFLRGEGQVEVDGQDGDGLDVASSQVTGHSS